MLQAKIELFDVCEMIQKKTLNQLFRELGREIKIKMQIYDFINAFCAPWLRVDWYILCCF